MLGAAEIVEETAEAIHAKAVSKAPYDPDNTGEHLRDSIHFGLGPNNNPGRGVSEIEVIAGTGLPDGRAVFNEYGTGARGESSTHPTPADGTSLSYTSSWPGMSAQPYMTPAAEEERQKFESKLKNLEKRLK